MIFRHYFISITTLLSIFRCRDADAAASQFHAMPPPCAFVYFDTLIRLFHFSADIISAAASMLFSSLYRRHYVICLHFFQRFYYFRRFRCRHSSLIFSPPCFRH
jgi:hypothetical protein